MSRTTAATLDMLIESWERQQDAYVAHRARRFEVIVDAVTYTRPDVRCVLDIGAGLGSFSKLLLQRFSDVQVYTLDYDPAMLALARHNLRDHADRNTVVEADLCDEAWTESLPDDRPEVVVSSTALHWLPSSRLVSLHESLARLLGEGGLFFNADHLSHPSGAFFREASAGDDSRQQQAAFETGVPDWDQWWATVRDLEGFDALIAERDRRFANAPENSDTSSAFHAESLRVAGFSEAGTLWQHFDDYVVYGVR